MAIPSSDKNPETSSPDSLALVLSVLESGHSVELPATGYSMFPVLRPGDSVMIRPPGKGEIPVNGTVVVFGDSKVLIMHRVVDITRPEAGGLVFHTRGDSMPEPDKPWTQHQLIGVAVSYKRGNRVNEVRTFIPGRFRYITNRRLLWVYAMIKEGSK